MYELMGELMNYMYSVVSVIMKINITLLINKCIIENYKYVCNNIMTYCSKYDYKNIILHI